MADRSEDGHGLLDDDGPVPNLIVAKDLLRNAFMEAGQFRYRCADGGFQAVSDNLLVHCLWHGEDCLEWYLQVVPYKAAVVIGRHSRDGET